MSRLLTLWCPDWPLVAVDDSEGPVAVLVGDRVLAASAAARAEGVRRGLRRREAQRRCPDLVLATRDEAAEARAFEPLLNALETVCPRIEVTRPGLCLFGTRGPGRYFGGDVALAAAVLAAVTGDVSGDVSGSADPPTARAGYAPAEAVRIGIADGPFASALAARRSPAADRPTIVPPGESPAFLAPYPVTALDHPELADLLGRLGIRTLGDLAALPARQVTSRFGAEGTRLHRLAGGRDDPPLRVRAHPAEFTVEEELDPPVDLVEPLAFVAKMLADRLADELERRGLACSRLRVEAESEHGEVRSRDWRHDRALTATAVAQRVRWQLEGWLTGPTDDRPSAGIVLLRLIPGGLHHADGEQLRLFGGPTDDDERAAAAVTRLQGLLGFDAVFVPVPAGGRDVRAQVRPVRWGEGLAAPEDADRPWPGRLCAPYPTVVPTRPVPVTLPGGPDEPRSLAVPGARPVPVAAWAGPWPLHERWWDGGRPGSRLQVVGSDGSAQLLVLRDAQWWLEGSYR